MSILGSIHPQLAGMNRATQKVAHVGERAAQGEQLSVNDSVDLLKAEQSFQANVKAVQTADQMTGVLLDIKT